VDGARLQTEIRGWENVRAVGGASRQAESESLLSPSPSGARKGKAGHSHQVRGRKYLGRASGKAGTFGSVSLICSSSRLFNSNSVRIVVKVSSRDDRGLPGMDMDQPQTRRC
jgi:hypothetical protein